MSDDFEKRAQEKANEGLSERDKREIDAMHAYEVPKGPSGGWLPSGCMWSFFVLLGVFFLIIGICSRG